MFKILDEFKNNLFCGYCGKITEHSVEKVDEQDNGEFIGFYAECDICENCKEVTEEELNTN